jgi:hypothetical protein
MRVVNGEWVRERVALCVCLPACLVSDQMGSLPCLALPWSVRDGEGRGGRVKGGCHCIWLALLKRKCAAVSGLKSKGGAVHPWKTKEREREGKKSTCISAVRSPALGLWVPSIRPLTRVGIMDVNGHTNRGQFIQITVEPLLFNTSPTRSWTPGYKLREVIMLGRLLC